jgi:hypothetical protein
VPPPWLGLSDRVASLLNGLRHSARVPDLRSRELRLTQHPSERTHEALLPPRSTRRGHSRSGRHKPENTPSPDIRTAWAAVCEEDMFVAGRRGSRLKPQPFGRLRLGGWQNKASLGKIVPKTPAPKQAEENGLEVWLK